MRAGVNSADEQATLSGAAIIREIKSSWIAYVVSVPDITRRSAAAACA
jgi:hypothetical protein